jgi:choline dehydrogenase-like flavoprotein
VVVPIDDLATVHPPPIEIASEITDEAFGRILRAMAHSACALYQSGALSVTPAHRLNTNVVGSMTINADDALNGRVDKIAADLLRRLESPQNLALQTPHPQGGNAIANSPSEGVVAGNFKVFGTANVFVADSSLFPAGCGRNPQLTTLALAHLAASSVLNCFQNNELGKLAR